LINPKEQGNIPGLVFTKPEGFGHHQFEEQLFDALGVSRHSKLPGKATYWSLCSSIEKSNPKVGSMKVGVLPCSPGHSEGPTFLTRLAASSLTDIEVRMKLLLFRRLAKCALMASKEECRAQRISPSSPYSEYSDLRFRLGRPGTQPLSVRLLKASLVSYSRTLAVGSTIVVAQVFRSRVETVGCSSVQVEC
jgi:hypothetical protein